MKEKINFFDLLILNNEEKIKEYLLVNGKAPKPVCPIMFIRNDEKEVIQNV